MTQWVWKSYNELSKKELYEILRLRQQVFILEQQCFYEDLDGLDESAKHLIAWSEDHINTSPFIQAYLRVLAPASQNQQTSIGRVLTHPKARGLGLGKDIINKAILLIQKEFPTSAIKISAQAHLEKFYAAFGFITISAPYDEDGILHIDMLKEN